MTQAKTNQRTLATIMFTDIAGYAALVQANEADTLAKARRDMELIARLCTDHGGRVIKNTGDGLLMHFTAAMSAVECALEVQHRLGHPGEGYLQHRIGLHLGDVFMTDDDMLGDGVNIAARVMTHADPGGICFSQTVYDVVKNAVALRATYLGAKELKNIREAIPMYQIIVAAVERHAARVHGGKVAATTTMPMGSERTPVAARRWVAMAAGGAAVILLALLGWWVMKGPAKSMNNVAGGPAAVGPVAVAPAVLAKHNPVTVGAGADQRMGFSLPKVEPLKDETPTLYLPDSVENIADVRITKLHYCLQDRPGRGLPRQVDLWVPAPNSTMNVVAGPAVASGPKSIQPPRNLSDGVYCLHVGALSAAPLPTFTSILIVRGFQKPSIAKTEVIAGGNQGTLKVTVANAGDGAFEDGEVFVTLQRKEAGGRPVFSGRWEKKIPTVAGRGSVTVEIPVDSREQVSGQYYCYGWIGYPYAMDSAMALDTFESATFSLGTK